jgi:hypothetical protein
MDHFVKLDRLPDGFRVPPDMKDRLCFDDKNHRLVHHGFMSKADFDRLSRLSDDWSYRRQLEELFRLCGPDDLRPRGFRRLIASLIGI